VISLVGNYITEKMVNYDAKSGDQIKVKTSYGWVLFIVQDTHRDWVSLKDANGRKSYYTYDRLIEMNAKFV
jgi:hypothetical protein